MRGRRADLHDGVNGNCFHPLEWPASGTGVQEGRNTVRSALLFPPFRHPEEKKRKRQYLQSLQITGSFLVYGLFGQNKLRTGAAVL